MFNSEVPAQADLPSSAQLIKSTIIAIITAIVLLVTIVLPAEYAIDPTGIGRLLKLTEMGEIKKQLSDEAEEDRKAGRHQSTLPAPHQRHSGLFGKIAGALRPSAHASERIEVAQSAAIKSDVTVFTLKPSEGVEYKMTMKRGGQVKYSWRSEGGDVNYDMHGTPGSGKETSYKAQRGVAGDEGVLTAAFDGSHGWFWRNRGKQGVKITLQTEGDYSDMKRMK